LKTVPLWKIVNANGFSAPPALLLRTIKYPSCKSLQCITCWLLYNLNDSKAKEWNNFAEHLGSGSCHQEKNFKINVGGKEYENMGIFKAW